MKYKGVDLTFDNYAKELESFSQDVRDEVRSAIMDNTPIGTFLDKCQDSPFLLQQLRLAVKESMPTWVLKLEDGGSIYRLRNLSGVSLEMVEDHVSSGLPTEYVEELISWIEEGAVIPEGIDLKRVPKTILIPFSKAVKKGLDAETLQELSKGDGVAAEMYYKIALKGLTLDIFRGKTLSNSALACVAELAGRPYIRSVVEVLESRSGGEEVNILWNLAKIGFDFSRFEGERYTSMQLSWIHQAYSEKMDVTEMLNPQHSNSDLSSIYNNLALDKSKRLSGRL